MGQSGSLVFMHNFLRWRSLISAFSVEIFLGQVILVTSKLALQWLSYQAPGVKGLALELVCPVPVYCVTGPDGKVDLQLLS